MARQDLSAVNNLKMGILLALGLSFVCVLVFLSLGSFADVKEVVLGLFTGEASLDDLEFHSVLLAAAPIILFLGVRMLCKAVKPTR